jgi:hypothetical protein
MKPSLVAAALVAALASGGRAHAGEDDRSLSLSVGYATIAVPDLSPHGLALAVEYERGFSEAMAFRVAATAGGYYEDDPVGSAHLVVGLTYLFDVLKYVPYVQGGVGGVVVAGPAVDTTLAPFVEVGVGLEILHSRSFSYGAAVRFESLLEETSFFSAAARVTWRWGFF